MNKTSTSFVLIVAAISALLFGSVGAHAQGTNLGPIVTTYQDMIGRTSITLPPANRCRAYYNTSSSAMLWIDHNGVACGPSAGACPNCVLNNQPNLYAVDQPQTFPADSTMSDLVLGGTITDPCCSENAGSIWFNPTSLGGSPHVNWFDGTSPQSLIQGSDTVCQLNDSCTGTGPVPRQRGAQMQSLTITDGIQSWNLPTGDWFDIGQGVTTPGIQNTPRAGHCRGGYNIGNNRLQLSCNNAAFSDWLVNGDLPSNIQEPVATSVLGGVPLEFASGTSATQTGSLGSQTIVATTPASTTWWRINFYVVQIALGSSCTGNTTISPKVTFNDPLASSPTTIQTQQNLIATNGTANTPLGCGVGGGASCGPYLFQTKSSTAISIQATYAQGTGCAANTPSYQVSYLLEKM